MERTEIDGVPVFWEQGPPPLSVGLCFGVGRRDESFARGGLTHLVEHLVMGSLPKSHLDRNASVGPRSTEFTATGRPEALTGFLAQVCDALRDLPTDRLATEARVLAAEDERSGPSLLGHLLTLRYGATGLGLLGMVEPALTQLTEQDAVRHAERWFVRENAVLWLTGEPPADLRLPLRSGAAPVRPPQHRLPLALPAQVRYGGPDPALSFEGPADDALLCGLRILLDRMTDRLRHQGGHSYDIDFDTATVDPGTAHVAFYADAPEQELGSVVEGMYAELHRLVEEGPTAEEIDHDVEGAREHFGDPRAAEGNAAAAALRYFDGLPPQETQERLRDIERLTPADVVAALRPALDGLLVLVPEDAPRVLPALPELPDDPHDPIEGREWKRRLRSDAPRRSRLTTSDQGVSLALPDTRITIRYDDCVAVGVARDQHQHLELVSRDGLTLPVCEEDWRGGRDLLAEVGARVAGIEQYAVDLGA